MTAVTLSGPSERRRLFTMTSSARAEALDAVLLLGLIVIGIAGFRDAYGGHDFLIAGAIGAILGIALGHIGQRVRLPLLAIAATAALLFVVLGGVFAQTGIATGLPTIGAMRDASTAAVHGWKQLLTTGRPVGSAAHLLVLPYLLGLVAGVAGHACARRTKRVVLPALPPAIVVALSILFGTDHPVAATLQGAVFAGAALSWASLRNHRFGASTATIRNQRSWQRLTAAAAVLTISIGGALVIGPHLPGAGGHHRVVLRTVPPFDINAYPSPLSGFRVYTKAADPSVSLYDKQLFATSGLSDGQAVRIAAMDAYDGLVWGVANAAASTSSFAGFQRIGSTLPGAPTGPVKSATVTISPSYRLPWLPDLAGTTGFTFDGAAGREVDGSLRFNVATGTGVVPGGLPAGLRYTVSRVTTQAPNDQQLLAASPYGTPDVASDVLTPIQAFANAHSGTATTPMAKVLGLASFLKNNGRYSDGSDSRIDVLPGHSLGRLVSFLQGTQIVGDGEQYAAAMALLANSVGVPARVVLDGTVENNAVVGRDVHADVELRLANYGWVVLPDSKFMGDEPPAPQPQKIPPPQVAQVVPPPVSAAPPATDESNNEAASISRKSPPVPKRHLVIHVPGIVGALLRDIGLPALVFVVIAAALIGTKSLRRRHRRHHGTPAARAAACWRETLDLSRDLGIRPHLHATRREQATYVEGSGMAGARGLAVAVDEAVFSRHDPDERGCAEVWRVAGQLHDRVISGLPRWQRLWVHVNPASLWTSRASGVHVARSQLLRGRFWRPRTDAVTP